MAGYEDRVWRVGAKLGRTIYAVVDEPGPDNRDVLLGMMETPELAAHVVALHNGRQSPPPEMLMVQ